MNDALRKRLALCNTLPSLPGAATRIVELGRDTTAGMSEVAEALKLDPALAAKVLRMANSALYARRRPCESFQQALVMLGLNATLTLALTFSLVRSLSATTGRGLDYERVWRRSLLAATAARVLGEHFGVKESEELFLAGLLQDIGMLALDRAFPELYTALTVDGQEHETIVELERSSLDCDHAEVGAWLLKKWNLPVRIQHLVARSHDALEGDPGSDGGQAVAARCVALSAAIADLWISGSPETRLEGLQLMFAPVPGMDGATLSDVISRVAEVAPEIEELFEVKLSDEARSDWIMQEAREVIVLRNLQMMQESTRLREVAASLQARARDLEEKSRRDNLTGAFNRGYLDDALSNWFLDANKDEVPISLAFVDLDNFKRVNDLYGHHCGDRVLVRSAEILNELARATDLVARYGGEEFVMLLPGCGAEGARRFCERVLATFAANSYDLESGERLTVTVSIGIATHGEDVRFDTCEHLLRSADLALYQAKQAGRNRCVVFGRSAHAA
jgi:diguanylate cyclase (GGDEF)-like protein